jgi:hypothetical protein
MLGIGAIDLKKRWGTYNDYWKNYDGEGTKRVADRRRASVAVRYARTQADYRHILDGRNNRTKIAMLR